MDAPIPVIVATENPVRVFDKVRRKVVNEVLLMGGAELPKQVPMLSEHEEHLRSLVGSLRSMNVVGDSLRAYAHFSARQSAQELRQDIVEGHVTDMSVGAERLEETFIDAGETQHVAGRVFNGPARIVTRWRPFHGAAVSRGADERAVFNPALRSNGDLEEAFRCHLVWLGMPPQLRDADAVAWAKENTTRRDGNGC